MDAEICNPQLCRICITSHTNSMQMISIFGEDSLWQKITTLADVKISKNDTLPQQVCVNCAKTAISACLFKKKCEDADNFYRQQLLIKKIEGHTGEPTLEPAETAAAGETETVKADRPKSCASSSSDSGSVSGSSSGGSSSSSSSISEDTDEEEDYAHDKIDGDVVESKVDEAQASPNNGHDKKASSFTNGHQLIAEQQQQKADDEDEMGRGQQHEGHKQRKQHQAELNEDCEMPEHVAFNSIRLMQEYMQQRMNKFPNGSRANIDADADDDDDEDEMTLPLVPEIELITPSDDAPLIATGPDPDESMMSGVGNDGSASHGAGGRGFQCAHCYLVFEMKQILKAHMQSVHGAPGPVYECTNCRKTYFYKRFLEKHIRRGRCVKKRRNQTRPMQCSDCHVLFPTGHHLGWHKRTGCPSKAAKMPLQQLLKQNIVQFNNFPKRVAPRKPPPDNGAGVHLNNRKLGLTNKRKGRTRIKLDAKKIALAKQLILREATTTVIANELNISRTFAWRLRKSLVNGVSLHERVVEQSTEEQLQQLQLQQQQQQHQQQQQTQQEEQERQQLSLPYAHLNLGLVKQEQVDSDDEHNADLTIDDELVADADGDVDGEVDAAGEIGAEETAGYVGDDDVCGLLHNGYDMRVRLQEEHCPPPLADGVDMVHERQSKRSASVSPTPVLPARAEVEAYQRLLAESQCFPHIVNARQVQLQQAQQQQQNAAHNGALTMLTRYPSAVVLANHALPVNLSLRSMPLMNSNESNGSSSSNVTALAQQQHQHQQQQQSLAQIVHQPGKKPRKPNVFIDDEKYAMAKLLVAQNASTMEIARALNVSQMTAWKVRDAILKGVPLSYRNKRAEGREEAIALAAREQQHQQQQQEQQQRHQQELQRQQQVQELQQQQKELLKQQQHKQQQHKQQQQQKQQQRKQQQQLQQQKRQQQELLLQQQQQQQLQQQQLRHAPADTLYYQQHQQQQQHGRPHNGGKLLHPRRRLKAAERELRDKEITREILELIKEDSNIQYWKVSARLAEKGINISPSSVCQKLKSMGIHRRWKPGDKPPMLAINQLKAATVAATAAATLAANGASNFDLPNGVNVEVGSMVYDAYEQQQFDMGGPHFLSAFTR